MFLPSLLQLLFDPAPPIASAGGGGNGGGAGGATPPATPPVPDISAALKQVTDALANIPALVDAAVAKAIPAKKEEKNEGEITAPQLAQQLEDERARNAVTMAVQAVTWFNPQEAIEHLRGRVKKTDAGYVIDHVEMVSGVPITKQVSLEQGVQLLAKSKSHWVKTTVAGGTGATGQSTTQNVAAEKQVTRKQLLEGNFDPAKIGECVIVD